MTTKRVLLKERLATLTTLHGSAAKAAAALGIEKAYWSRMASGQKTNPTAETLKKLGLDKVTYYVISEEKPPVAS